MTYSVLKVPLNPNQPTNQPFFLQTACAIKSRKCIEWSFHNVVLSGSE